MRAVIRPVAINHSEPWLPVSGSLYFLAEGASTVATFLFSTSSGSDFLASSVISALDGVTSPVVWTAG